MTPQHIYRMYCNVDPLSRATFIYIASFSEEVKRAAYAGRIDWPAVISPF